MYTKSSYTSLYFFLIVYYNKIYTSCMPLMKIWYTSLYFFLIVYYNKIYTSCMPWMKKEVQRCIPNLHPWHTWGIYFIIVDNKKEVQRCIPNLHPWHTWGIYFIIVDVAYAFSWFTKFHGFTILTGTTKTGIQQIKLSIHTIREILQNFIYCILHSYKFVNCIFDH
jgi:hypothetical protein